MFCTSLRRRKQWATAATVLLKHDKFKFRENKIDSHDVNLPLPSPQQPGQRYLRFVLLSSADEESAYKLQRVERLYNLSGGSDAAVLWLLDESGDPFAFMQFQIGLMDKFEIPLVPLQTIEELPTTLLRFHRSFLQAHASTRQSEENSASGPVQTLLPHCTLAPPLCEHSTNVLSDLAIGFADLANKANSEAGRAEILDYLGQEEAERVIMFWIQEYLL
ncbi:unnamed protein product [Discula destructiva]